MKDFYIRVPRLLALVVLLFYLPTHSIAQCLCSDGSAPQTLTYSQTRAITPLEDSTDFFLMQFNPTLGQLTCADVFSFVTTVVRMRLENDELFPLTYRVSYQKTSRITGPGLTPDLINNVTKNYGPYNLAATDGVYFSGPDYVFIGPDSVLKNRYFNRLVNSAVAPFLGYGTLSFNYKGTGKTTVTGGINYIFSVSSQDVVTVGVTYSYCPMGLLANGLNNFKAVRKAKEDVLLTWTAQNEVSSNQYELELSRNSNDFASIGKVNAQTVGGSTASSYQFPYHINNTTGGTLYFRVKQISADGKVTYSPIRSIALETAPANGIGVYPNPARNKVQLQFDRPLQGEYELSLVSVSGQVVMSRMVTISHTTNVLNLELGEKTTSGVYYLKAREVKTRNTFVSKLVVANQ